MTSVDGGTADDTGSGTIDGGDIAVDEELLDVFRETVRAQDATKYPAEKLTGYLKRAKYDVDRRIGQTIGIEVDLIRGWYIAVAAELFDRDNAPSPSIPDRFGGDGAVTRQRPTRNPLQVVEREIRLWVPTW